jgi:hypothetical protein
MFSFLTERHREMPRCALSFIRFSHCVAHFTFYDFSPSCCLSASCCYYNYYCYNHNALTPLSPRTRSALGIDVYKSHYTSTNGFCVRRFYIKMHTQNISPRVYLVDDRTYICQIYFNYKYALLVRLLSRPQFDFGVLANFTRLLPPRRTCVELRGRKSTASSSGVSRERKWCA